MSALVQRMEDVVDVDQMAAEVEAGARRAVDTDELLGLTWMVSHGDEVRGGSLGHLDADGGRPTSLDTVYRISSMTKPVTAAAALMLIEDGAIALDEPVDEWLPELAGRPVLRTPGSALDDTVPASRPITVEDLLTFRLGHGMDFTDFSPTPLDDALESLGLGAGPPAPAVPPGPDEWIRRLGSVPLRCQPGERWLYHTGADVLGVLIARVAGQPFEEVLAERVFQPLGMVDTAFFVGAQDLDRFGACFTVDASGARTEYDPADGQWSSPPAFAGGGAGLVSTVGDFHRFADMLRRGGVFGDTSLLLPSTIRAMTTNHLTDEQRASGTGDDGWGYGVGLQLRDDGPLSAGSYGWNGGLGSVWCTDPVTGVIGLLLTNQMWTSPTPPPVVDAFVAALRG